MEKTVLLESNLTAFHRIRGLRSTSCCSQKKSSARIDDDSGYDFNLSGDTTARVTIERECYKVSALLLQVVSSEWYHNDAGEPDGMRLWDGGAWRTAATAGWNVTDGLVFRLKIEVYGAVDCLSCTSGFLTVRLPTDGNVVSSWRVFEFVMAVFGVSHEFGWCRRVLRCSSTCEFLKKEL
jgi:hypothetical protein